MLGHLHAAGSGHHNGAGTVQGPDGALVVDAAFEAVGGFGRQAQTARGLADGAGTEHGAFQEDVGAGIVDLGGLATHDTGQGHGALVGFLQAQEVNAVIAGGIGGGAKQGLAEASIDLYGGVTGSADDAVKELLNGTLKFNPDVACSHHDHQHDHGEHHCGTHGCGGHQ